MIFDDRAADGKTQAKSLRLRSEEGFKELLELLVGHSAATVAYGELHFIASLAYSHDDLFLCPPLRLHGIDAIPKQIDQNLLNLARLHMQGHLVLRFIDPQFDARNPRLVVHQQDRVINQRLESHRLTFRPMTPSKPEQAANDVTGPVRGGVDRVGPTADLIQIDWICLCHIRACFREIDDRTQGLIHFVGNAASSSP